VQFLDKDGEDGKDRQRSVLGWSFLFTWAVFCCVLFYHTAIIFACTKLLMYRAFTSLQIELLGIQIFLIGIVWIAEVQVGLS